MVDSKSNSVTNMHYYDNKVNMLFIVFTVVRKSTPRYIIIRRHYDRGPRHFSPAVILVGARCTTPSPPIASRQDRTVHPPLVALMMEWVTGQWTRAHIRPPASARIHPKPSPCCGIDCGAVTIAMT